MDGFTINNNVSAGGEGNQGHIIAVQRTCRPNQCRGLAIKRLGRVDFIGNLYEFNSLVPL